MNTQMRSSGRDMLVYQVGDVDELDGCIRSLPLRSNVDAVVAIALDLDEKEIAQLDEIGVPVVFCSQFVECRPSVFIDNSAAAAAATRHLLNLGHTRIAYINSRDATGFSWSSRDRLRGYRQAMAAAGAEPLVVTERPGHEGGALATGRLLSLDVPPTAVFAESDDVAMGVLRVLRRSRLDVPEVVSVMGFDDSDTAELLDLTTMAQPVFDMGACAARLADRVIDAPDSEPEHVQLETRLVVRQSTSTPRSTRNLTS